MEGKKMEPITVTVADACKAIGVGRTVIYELLAAGRLESIHLGRRRLIKTDSIRRLVNEPAQHEAV
jgi:excisionase family DNA binding protein